MKTISTLLQAKKAAPGLYAVKDAEGVTLNKRGKAFGGGGFNFRFTLGGERLLMSFGSPNDFDDLDEVKDAATAARKLVKEGINPADDRERRRIANLVAKQPVTFRQKAEAVLELENIRDLCREFPSLEAQARALYGFSAKRIRGVGEAQRGALRRFIYETSNLVSDHKSHGKLVAPLICPVLGIDWLTAEDVRKHLDAYKP